MSERFAPGQSFSNTDILLRASADCVNTDDEFRWLEKYRNVYKKLHPLQLKEGQIGTKIDMLRNRPKVSQTRISRLQDKKYKIRLKIEAMFREMATIQKEHLEGVLKRATETELKMFRNAR